MTEKKETVEEVKETPKKTTTRRRTATKKVEKSPEELAREMAQEMAREMAADIAKEIAKEMVAGVEAKKEDEIKEIREALKEAKREARERPINGNVLVPVRSLAHGEFVHRTRDGIVYSWEDLGSIQELPMSEIRSIRNSKSGYFTKGYLVIEDEKVAKELNLHSLYEHIDSTEDLVGILKLPIEELESTLDSLPEGVVKSLGHYAAELIRKGELNNIKVIKLLQDKTMIDYKMVLPSL